MESNAGSKGIYAELHCLSNFSFLRGASHPQELVRTAAELGYAGLALTDECSVAGVVRAYTAAKELPLKLVVGSELRCTDDGLKLVALAESRQAYAALCGLISRARRARPAALDAGVCRCCRRCGDRPMANRALRGPIVDRRRAFE